MKKHKQISKDFYWINSNTKQFILAKASKPVKIKGFESFDFALVEGNTLAGEAFISVTEGRTGMRIETRSGIPAKAKLIDVQHALETGLRARAEGFTALFGDTLADARRAAFNELIEKTIKKYGLSPRYEEIVK